MINDLYTNCPIITNNVTVNNTRQRLPQLLTEMAEKDIRKYSLVLDGCRMIYVPDIRYVLAVTAWEGEPPKDYDIPGLEFKFVINGVPHYKSDGARGIIHLNRPLLLQLSVRIK